MSSKKQMERKYQAIKLYNSGQISLQDMKALFRIVTVVAHDEYTSKGKQKKVLGADERIKKLNRLTMTRSAAAQEKILALNTKPKLTATRDEAIAKFATRFTGGIPHSFDRYGPLIAKTKRVNPPRPGSSKGKIGKPNYRGFEKFNRDFDDFQKSLLILLRSGDRKAVGKAIKKVRDSINVGTKRN